MLPMHESTKHTCTWKRRIIMVIPFIIHTRIFIWIKELGSFIIYLNSKSIHRCRLQEHFAEKKKNVFVCIIPYQTIPLYVIKNKEQSNILCICWKSLCWFSRLELYHFSTLVIFRDHPSYDYKLMHKYRKVIFFYFKSKILYTT